MQMKKNHFFTLFLVLILGSMQLGMSAINYDDITEEVTQAIREGNSRKLAEHFGDNVDLVLPDNDGTFSKAHAELILRNFFSDNRPETFTINHQRASRDGSPYVIGTLETRDNKSYRIYFLIKKVSDNYFIHQLQFELQ